jgi:two-component system, cell cycle sensor histidine kinase and response regulator CckA
MEPTNKDESQARLARILRARSSALRYGVALLLTGAAAGIDLLFPHFSSKSPFSSFYLSSGIAAWFGGFRAGLLATAAALALGYYYFIPAGGFSTHLDELVRIILIGFTMAVLSWLIDSRARTRQWIEIERERVEDQQRRFQAMLSSAARIAGTGSWEYDIANDRLEWDDETLRIFGTTREAFGGNAAAFFALVHPEDREALRAMQIKARPSHGITEMEYRIVRPDGAVRRIHDRGQVTRHQNGKAVESTGMVMDITERKQAEEALRASEQRWRAIFENSAVGIALADRKGFFTLTNRAYQKMVGFTEEELRSMTYLDLTYDEDRTANLELGKQLWKGDLQQYQQEKRYRRKDGKLIWVRNTVSLVPGTQISPQFGMAIVEDITERRSLEEQVRQSQRMEAVGRLAGGVAHDFNNMLGVILGHCLSLQERLPVGTSEWQSAQQINKASTRAAELTRQLLAFSRKQILLPRVVDLNATIADLSSMLDSLIGDDIELVVRPGENLGYVKTDPGQIGQVVMNLVVNARDAMPQGGRVVIATENVVLNGQPAAQDLPIAAGPYIMLSVSDNGCGIEAETLSHIFEPFFTTKEQGHGTGLGLATVYGIIKQSDGYIVAESQPGTGTTFKIYLPRAEGELEITVTEHERSSADRGEETVLLAEDEPMLREVVRLQLEDAGYTVLQAHNGSDALLQAQNYKGKIDLLLTDVLMDGGMNGIGLATLLEQARPELKVLYMTGYTADAIDAKGLADLQDKVLQKPFTADVLRHRIREVLAAKESEKPSAEARSVKP